MTPPERPEVAALAEKMVAAGSPLNVLTEAGWRIVLMALRDRFPELAREVSGASVAEPLRGAAIEMHRLLARQMGSPHELGTDDACSWCRAALEATAPTREDGIRVFEKDDATGWQAVN